MIPIRAKLTVTSTGKVGSRLGKRVPGSLSPSLSA